MIDFVKIIKNDDLESFKEHFKIENWKDSITQIENYAGVDNKYIKEVSYNDADCFKYAVHCNANKIFDYLLPQVHVDKHGDNYGWPLLSMAVKNENYDYANKIVNHKTFNPYSGYHTINFRYFDKHPKLNEHIELLFNYLNKFHPYDFDDKHLLHDFRHLICHSEETFNRCDNFYKEKIKDPSASILDIYKDHMDILGEEIFGRKYNKFIIEKLNAEDIANMIKNAMNNEIYFSELFESENAKDGLTYLVKAPNELKNYFEDKKVQFSFISLECILVLIENGIDIWEEDTSHKRSALDYILKDDNIEDEATWYFINKYPQEILARCQQNRDYNIEKFCKNKILQNELEGELLQNNNSKKHAKI